MFDVRVLGHFRGNQLMWYTEGIRGIVGNTALTDFDREWSAKESAWYVTAVFKFSGSKMRYRVRPDYDWNIDLIETEGSKGDDHWKSKTVSEYRKIGPSGTWFPATVTYSQSKLVGGLKTETTEKVKVIECQLNEPVDSKHFTYAAFGMPTGTPVEDPVTKKVRYWYGTDLRDEAVLPTRDAVVTRESIASVVAEPIPETPLESEHRWMYWCTAGVLVVAGVGLFLVRRQT